MSEVVKAFLRYLARRRALSLLLALGVCFGVASAIGMRLSGDAALDGMKKAVAFVNGAATHTLTARSGGTLPERLLEELARDPDVHRFAPVIDRRIGLEGDVLVRVLGVDPFLERPFRSAHGALFTGEVDQFFSEPATLFLDRSLAENNGIAQGDGIGSDHGPLTVVGFFEGPGSQPLAFMDMGNAQRFFDLAGRIDRVDLILRNPEGFVARWGVTYHVAGTTQRQRALLGMLDAFTLNLTALSLLGLLVGVFLVYNTATFAVVSRARDVGVLIALGASRLQIAMAFGAELLLLGAAGGAIGAVAGFQLSETLTGVVGSAISNLYYFLQPDPARWSMAFLAQGVGLGMVTCLAGGLIPLVNLLRTDPARVLTARAVDRESSLRVRWAALGALPFLAASAWLYLIESPLPAVGLAAVSLLLVGASLLCGLFTDGGCLVFSPLFRGVGRFLGLIALGNVRRYLGRSSVSVAAFMVALSASLGMGLMIGSFRSTLVWWMESQLTGELYVAPSVEVEMPPELVAAIEEVPGIGGVDRYRNTRIPYAGDYVAVSAVDAVVLSEFSRFAWYEGDTSAWDDVIAGDVIISESFHRRFGHRTGDTLVLNPGNPSQTVRVAGIFYDYTSEHGLIMMDRFTYLRWFDDPIIDSVAVFLREETPESRAALERIKALAARWEIPAVEQEELHSDILSVFESTFSVTRSMQMLAILVAFFGMSTSMLTLFMERRKNLGMYRSLGFSADQLVRICLLEGLALGLISLCVALGVGVLIARLLIDLVNLQSFHWTIFFRWSAEPFLMTILTGVAASLLAAVYPAWAIWNTYPALQLRDE